MNTIISNPRQLKDLILRRLGAPVINIEITEEQIYDCIYRALELYGEYHYQGLNKNYYIIKVSEAQAKTGLFEMQPQIFAVTRIIRTSSGAFLGMGGGTMYTWVSDFVQSIMGNNMNQGQCYSAQTLSGMGGNLSYYSSMMSSLNLMQDILNPLPEFFYNTQNNQLQVYKNFQEGDLLVIEAYTKSFDNDLDFSDNYYRAGNVIYAGEKQEQVYGQTRYENPQLYARVGSGEIVTNLYQNTNDQSAFDNRWLKDYSTALTKEVWGQILSKHQGMSLPGGVQIDGNRLIQEAKEEIQNLREELYQLTIPDMILYG